MTKDEALDLALEALENLFGIPDQWTGEGGGDVAVWRLGGSHRARQAITAIKQALAAPYVATPLVQEPIGYEKYAAIREGHRNASEETYFAARPDLPLTTAMLKLFRDGFDRGYETTPPAAQQDIQRLSALVRAQQITIDKLEAQRQWVGLTNKEIYDCEPKTDWYDSVEFAQAIEAKLKEKNT